MSDESKIEKKQVAEIKEDDAAFLQRLSKIRTSKWNIEQARFPTPRPHSDDAERFHYINNEFYISVNEDNLHAIHKNLIDNPYPNPDNPNSPRILSLFIATWDAKYKDIQPLLLNTHSNSNNKKITKMPQFATSKMTLTIGKSSKEELRLWLEIKTPIHPPNAIIELDVLTDRELIERLFQKENLLE